MKNSLKPLVGIIGTLSINFGMGLPTLAQPQPMLSQVSPSPTLAPEEQPVSPTAPTPASPAVPTAPEASPIAPEASPIAPTPDRPSDPALAPEAQPASPTAPAPASPAVPAAPVRVSVPASSSSQTVDAIVRQSPSFELFNALLRVANNQGILNSALAGGSDYTIFAPTDEALVALPSGLFKALVQPENRETLVRILKNHIVRGKVLSNQLSGQEIRSLDGNILSLGSVPVIAPDIQASNGVIHAINGVILPPDVQSSLAGLIPQPVTSNTPSQ